MEHGSMWGYRGGCRCGACKDANNDYMKAYRMKRKPALEDALDTAELIQEGDTSWVEFGACKGEDITIFFPVRGDNSAVQQAKVICNTCTVKSECLAYALRTDQEAGVWGGASGRERREMQSMIRRGVMV